VDVHVTLHQDWPAHINSKRMLCSLDEFEVRFVVSECESDDTSSRYTLVNAIDISLFESDDYKTLLPGGSVQDIILV